MANAQVEKFRQTLPDEESELVICPPNCTEQHDVKWHGVTVPLPKKEKATAHSPQLFMHTPPKPRVEWEDSFPSLHGKEWREAMKRDGKSCWRHHDPPVEGEIIMIEPPTRRQLEKHAKLYGVKSPATIASVHEVAAVYGISGLNAPRPIPKKKGPRGLNMTEKAQQLVDLGYEWDVIEDELNLSRQKSIDLRTEIYGGG